jgi:putative nucleotidyltransferase with HDIG domain
MTEAIAAIILSAGFSQRMGGFKPLLPLGNKTALERTIELFQRAGVAHLQVVTGHRAEELQPLLQQLQVQETFNQKYQEGMFSSVQCALRAMPDHIDAFFLQPVDMPLVRDNTLPQLLRARQNSGRGIIHPLFFGKRGHPPLISTRYRDTILNGDGNGGLKALLLPYEDDILELEVADEHTILDMDTPGDYNYLCHRWCNYQLPSPRECEHLMVHKFSCDKQIIDHCQQVAQVADRLAETVNESGGEVNRELLQAAALLHDCRRSQPHHAAVGAAELCRLGFPQIAELIQHHMDLEPGPAMYPDAAEILYLADKLVVENRCVSLEERFAERLKCFADQPGPLAAIRQRLAAAQKIQHKIYRLTGNPIEQLLNPSAISRSERITHHDTPNA